MDGFRCFEMFEICSMCCSSITFNDLVNLHTTNFPGTLNFQILNEHFWSSFSLFEFIMSFSISRGVSGGFSLAVLWFPYCRIQLRKRHAKPIYSSEGWGILLSSFCTKRFRKWWMCRRWHSDIKSGKAGDPNQRYHMAASEKSEYC